MGEWRRVRSFKFSEEESAMLLAVHNALAPIHETESQTLRWILRVVHMLIFTEGSLQFLLTATQGLQRGTVYDRAKQFTFRFAAPRGKEELPLIRLKEKARSWA